MKTDINLIQIPKCFSDTTPNPGKMQECRSVWKNFGCQDRYIVIDKNGCLIDGYIQYLILKENGVELVETRHSNYKVKKYHRIPPYRYTSTLYIYGKHYDSETHKYSKEYVWRVPESCDLKLIEDIIVGKTIPVNTKYGISDIVVTKMEILDRCPVGTNVREIVIEKG